MLLLFLVDVALTADNPKKPYAVENREPAVEGVTAIPPCEDSPYHLEPCFDLFYTPNTSALIRVRAVGAGGGAGRGRWEGQADAGPRRRPHADGR